MPNYISFSSTLVIPGCWNGGNEGLFTMKAGDGMVVTKASLQWKPQRNSKPRPCDLLSGAMWALDYVTCMPQNRYAIKCQYFPPAITVTWLILQFSETDFELRYRNIISLLSFSHATHVYHFCLQVVWRRNLSHAEWICVLWGNIFAIRVIGFVVDVSIIGAAVSPSCINQTVLELVKVVFP